MPTLSDICNCVEILRDYRDCCVHSETVQSLSEMLGVSCETAAAMYGRYGEGLYGLGLKDFLADTPTARRDLSAQGFVAVTRRGCRLYPPRKPQIRLYGAFRDRKAEALRKSQRQADRLHTECQGHPCPKRQGKANSLADMGFYVGNGPKREIPVSNGECYWGVARNVSKNPLKFK